VLWGDVMRPTAFLVRAWRLWRMTIHVVRGLLTLAFVFPRTDGPGRDKRVRRWGGHVLKIFAVGQVVVKPPGFDVAARKRLYIGNHVSWLDIYALQAVTAARFVAKKELSQWPVLGRLIRESGTVFIEREKRRDTLKINQTLQESLSRGDVLAVFPEGTTTDGRDVQKFHGNLLQGALDCGAEIVPFCLRYLDEHGEPTTIPAYIGEMTFWDSIQNVLRARRLGCELTFYAPLEVEGRSRRDLAYAAETLVRQRLSGYTSEDR
jgi:1-acyl-sn-glycerol-3-phosphate acyltransferase